jgi:alpha-glucosidase
LPEGNWYYYFNNEVFQGGKEVSIPTPLDEMPIFVKSGTILPEYPVMQFTGEKKIEALKLVVYYGAGEQHSYSYTDHGDTFAFEQDVFLERHFVTIGTTLSLTIRQQREGLYTERYDTYKLYLVGLPFDLSRAVVDGIEVEISRDGGQQYIEVDNDFRKIVLE